MNYRALPLLISLCLALVSCDQQQSPEQKIKKDHVPPAADDKKSDTSTKPLPKKSGNMQQEKQALGKGITAHDPLVFPIGLKALLPHCSARITVTVGEAPNGTVAWKEFVIQVCDLPSNAERARFGTILKSERLAQGALWTNLQDNDEWSVIEYQVPRDEDDFKKLETEGVERFQQKVYVSREQAPSVIYRLPHPIQEKILGFMAYPNGGLEIFLLNNNEVAAQKILQAVEKVLKEDKTHPQ